MYQNTFINFKKWVHLDLLWNNPKKQRTTYFQTEMATPRHKRKPMAAIKPADKQLH